ncbi:hypothetical protein [Anaerospora sp.]|uniref:hypothetical protein n=1 Tax=Anaerospora sp. TaxID=1960278 RepID=UPI00289FA486|nr:hypothetical protein [Anaerospora sp.]
MVRQKKAKPQKISIWCEKCDKPGAYTASNPEENRLLICNKCEWMTSDVWCPKCGMGGPFVDHIEERPLKWQCPECKTEFSLPEEFYEEPIRFRLERQTKKPNTRMLMQDSIDWIFSINKYVLLLPPVILYGILSLANEWIVGEASFYAELFRRGIFVLGIAFIFSPIFIMLLNIWLDRCKTIWGIKEKVKTTGFLLLPLLIISFWYIPTASQFLDYVLDYPVVQEGRAFTGRGVVQEVIRKKGIVGANVWINGQLFYYTWYDRNEIKPGDQVTIKYSPRSRHIIDVLAKN